VDDAGACSTSVLSGCSVKKVPLEGNCPCLGLFCQVETLTEGALHGTPRPSYRPDHHLR
jgi:hypothetical protein